MRRRRYGQNKFPCYLGVKLSHDLNEALVEEAGTRGLDKSEIVREILKRELLQIEAREERRTEFAE